MDAPPAAAAAAPAKAESQSALVFSAIKAHVEAHPELKQVATVFQFRLSDPESVWTIDLKQGAVDAGESAKPECTLALSDTDFMAMTKGQADPQKLFMDGKLKITGNLMASQKLTFLKDVKPTGAAPAAKSSGPAFFEKLVKKLKPGAGNARILFKLTDPTSEWLVDLKKGTVERGAGQADATLTLSEETLLALAGGAPAKALFQQGKLRVDGDVLVAHRLEFLL
jgi:3-hydroxyacyl-CoA dehydrogenase/3a,7a,12a-trihydroxy-5b-cholest-24-enoyl-CoA hydratase